MFGTLVSEFKGLQYNILNIVLNNRLIGYSLDYRLEAIVKIAILSVN